MKAEDTDQKMNSRRSGNEHRRWRWVAIPGALVALGMGIAACGGGSPKASPSSSGKAHIAAAIKYSKCMRSHGVTDFPEPNSNGNFQSSGNGSVSQSTTQAAQTACQKLLPSGQQPSSAQQAQATQNALKFSQCMRSHGVSNFPDPQVSSGSVGFPLGQGIDTKAPQFQAAESACQSLIPGGSQSNGSAGS